MPPPQKLSVLEWVSRLPTIPLFVIVGELLKMNTPPPAIASGGVPPAKVRYSPDPPVMRKPSSRSEGMEPLPQTTAAQTRFTWLGTHWAVVQGTPVASMIVLVGPF